MPRDHRFLVGRSKGFTAVVTADRRRRVLVPVPFDPDDAWGTKQEHHVAGTVNGMRVRAVIEPVGNGRGILLGPAWRRDCGIGPGEVTVVLAPEGPQREELPPDVAAALEAEPAAAAFFDSLAQFYRWAYLSWIDATKRRPEVRAARIHETIELLKAGVTQRRVSPSSLVGPALRARLPHRKAQQPSSRSSSSFVAGWPRTGRENSEDVVRSREVTEDKCAGQRSC